MKKIMIFAAAMLLVSSCGVYNKYERPDVETTGLVRDVVSDVDTLVVQDTASFPSCRHSSSKDWSAIPTC